MISGNFIVFNFGGHLFRGYCPEGFWNDVKDTVIAGLAAGKAGEGLAAGIRLAGEQLSAHFPVADDDVNELSDDIMQPYTLGNSQLEYRVKLHHVFQLTQQELFRFRIFCNSLILIKMHLQQLLKLSSQF